MRKRCYYRMRARYKRMEPRLTDGTAREPKGRLLTRGPDGLRGAVAADASASGHAIRPSYAGCSPRKTDKPGYGVMAAAGYGAPKGPRGPRTMSHAAQDERALLMGGAAFKDKP